MAVVVAAAVEEVEVADLNVADVDEDVDAEEEEVREPLAVRAEHLTISNDAEDVHACHDGLPYREGQDRYLR